MPDSLDGTVDQNDRKGPPLLVEDLALVSSSEQGFATAWWCPDRIGIEEWEQVDRLYRFNALHERKGCTQGESSPPFYLDSFHLLC